MSYNAKRYQSQRAVDPQDMLPEPQMSDIDFRASDRLVRALRGRTRVEGYTVDPPGTHIMDDGLSIKRNSMGWKIMVSIVDLPSIIPDGSRLEKLAAERLKESFVNRRPRRIWPTTFLDQYASMMGNTIRPTISFKICLDNDFNIVDSKIRRTAFLNKGEHADGAFNKYTDFVEKRQQDWCELAHGLYRKRCNELAYSFDSELDKATVPRDDNLTDPNGNMEDGELLIHEVMRLTSRVAAEYFQANSLIVPFKPQKIRIDPSLVTPDHGFDVFCNRFCINLTEEKVKEGLPYIRVNSPMRRYQDYLALKVLGNHLDGRPQDPVVRGEIINLRGAFNRLAGNQGYLLAARWGNEWHAQLKAQDKQVLHPLDSLRQNNDRNCNAHALKALYKANQWPQPLIAERELHVQGTTLYFTGISQGREKGMPVHDCAVAANRDVSLNLAAQRVLRQISGRTGPQEQQLNC